MTTEREFLKKQVGRGIWIGYGIADAEIEGYVLSVDKHTVAVQRKDTGDVVPIPLWAITEMVEA